MGEDDLQGMMADGNMVVNQVAPAPQSIAANELDCAITGANNDANKEWNAAVRLTYSPRSNALPVASILP